jgi:hypothetical protein
MFGMTRRGAAFVVRQHGQLQGERGGRLTHKGARRSGPVYEQPLLVRDPDGGETMRVRRITVQLKEPTWTSCRSALPIANRLSYHKTLPCVNCRRLAAKVRPRRLLRL